MEFLDDDERSEAERKGAINMEDFKKFISQYRGAIIGVIVAIVVLATRLYELIVGILLILAGAFVGNYVQQNKFEVKEKLKNFIDRL